MLTWECYDFIYIHMHNHYLSLLVSHNIFALCCDWKESVVTLILHVKDLLDLFFPVLILVYMCILAGLTWWKQQNGHDR